MSTATDIARPSTRTPTWLVGLGLSLLALVVRLPTFFSPRHVGFDDGVYGASVLMMREGARPYHEVFSPQGPLHYPILFVGDLLGLRTLNSPRVASVVATTAYGNAGLSQPGIQACGRVGRRIERVPECRAVQARHSDVPPSRQRHSGNSQPPLASRASRKRGWAQMGATVQRPRVPAARVAPVWSTQKGPGRPPQWPPMMS